MAKFRSDKPFDDPHGRGHAPHKRVSEPFHRPVGHGAKNQGEKVCFIANPQAGAGAVGRRQDELRRAIDRAFANWDLRMTEGPRHATELAAKAIDEGFDLVGAIGGDGTCNEVVNGYFDGDRPRNRKCAFVLVPFGTGSDLMKSLQLPHSLANALFVAATGVTLPSDVGRARFVAHDGAETSRWFVNVAGFGANGDVVARANAMDKRWGGRVTFLRASLASAREYRPSHVELRWDDGSWNGELMAAFVANGAYCGGGMWVGRGGSMQDGFFDVTLLPPTPLARQVIDVRHLYLGHPGRMAGARRAQVTHLEGKVVSGAPVPIDLDGEMVGVFPAQFDVVPRVLPVRGGWLHQTIAPRTAGA